MIDPPFLDISLFDGLVKSPSAALRFRRPLKGEAHQGPHSPVLARLVPPVAGELFAKPSFYRLFTSSSVFIISQFEAKDSPHSRRGKISAF
jgi:hypothetical protein